MDAPHLFTVLVVADGDGAALRARLESHPEVTVVDVCGPEQVDQIVGGGAPDVVVLESAGALARLGPVGATAPATRIAVIPGDDAVDPAAAIHAHVGAIVPPGADAGDVVVSLARGEAFLDAALAAAVIDGHRARPGDPLTPTEEEVVGRMASGESAEAIAETFGVTPRLVRLHAGGALARLFRPR